MARLFSSGFELNSLTAAVEFETITGAPTIVTSPVRSGTYALNATGGANDVRHPISQSTLNGPLYMRVAIYVTTLPSAITTIMVFLNNATTRGRIRMATDGSLELWDAANKKGSSSAALSLNTWYYVELSFFNNTVSGSGEVEGRLNGSSFATATAAVTTGAVNIVAVGNASAATTFNATFDDWAVNDSSGSAQISWPGDGKIIHLHPNAAGDNAQGSRGGADSGSDWGQLDEVTPNDATDYYILDATNDIIDVNVESATGAGIGASDTITLVAVGIRMTGADTSGNHQGQARIKSASGGTTTTANHSSVNTATWYTQNNATGAKRYVLNSYTDPTTTVAWTPTGTNSLENMQIGVAAPDATPDVWVSTLWALVEYVPNVGGGTPTYDGTMLTMF